MGKVPELFSAAEKVGYSMGACTWDLKLESNSSLDSDFALGAGSELPLGLDSDPESEARS